MNTFTDSALLQEQGTEAGIPVPPVGSDILATERIEGRLRTATIDELLPDPDQPRTKFDKDALLRLGQSLIAEGQKELVQVRLWTSPMNPKVKYEIINGERRWRSCKLVGKPTLEILIREVKDRIDQHLTSLMLNFHQVGHTHMEISHALKRQREAGKSTENLAVALGKSSAWVDQYLALQKLTRELQELMDPDVSDTERLRFGVAVALSALSHEQQIEGYARTQSEGSAKHRLRIAQEFAREIMPGRGRGRKPSDGVAVFLSFVKRVDRDVEGVLDMPQSVFSSLINNRPKEETLKVLKRLKGTREKMDELINAVERTMKV